MEAAPVHETRREQATPGAAGSRGLPVWAVIVGALCFGVFAGAGVAFIDMAEGVTLGEDFLFPLFCH